MLLGGIVGELNGYTSSSPFNYAIIENCASINNYIEGNINAGGVCSDLYESKAINCYNTSEVVCTSTTMGATSGNYGRAAGICAGCIDGGEIYNCYNTGKISAPQTRAGGILGAFGQYPVYNCYNVGEISGKYTGELFGEADYAEIKNCYYLSGKTPTGIKGTFDYEDGNEYDVKAITAANLKLESAINLLNQNGYSSYKKDTQNINGGYPILSWQ